MNEKYYIELIKEKDFLIAKQSKTIGELATKYFTLEKDVKELALENKRLRDIISKNSSNSSKPPASDYAKKTSSLREKSHRKPGGQRGHEGNTLKQIDIPDEKINHTPTHCPCGCCIESVEPHKTEKRQIIEIPTVKYTVTEHISEHKICPNCGSIIKGTFPQEAKAPVNYGDNIKSQISYMMNYQLIPFKRTQEMVMDLFNLPISEGTLCNIKNELASQLDIFMENSRNALLKSPVLHLDETGISINGVRHWLHVASNKFITLLFPHANRGKNATDEFNILPSYKGIVIHDCWKTYFTYKNCRHGLCNIHLLRELKFFNEQDKYLWSDRFAKLLIGTKDICDDHRFKGINFLLDDTLDTIDRTYDSIIKEGFSELLLRGSIKENKNAYNLLKRLRDYKTSILYFAYDFNVPFDNNLAEQDLRMEKLRQKNSGTLRSSDNGLNTTKIRSYIKTARKNSINVLEAFILAFAGNPFLPLRC